MLNLILFLGTAACLVRWGRGVRVTNIALDALEARQATAYKELLRLEREFANR